MIRVPKCQGLGRTRALVLVLVLVLVETGHSAVHISRLPHYYALAVTAHNRL